MMKKTDRRILRTKKLLRIALMEIIEAGEYDCASITDITKKADIGYRTFYRHYQSKEALLVDLTREEFLQLSSLLRFPTEGLFNQSPKDFNPGKNASILFGFIRKNEKLFREVFNEDQSVIGEINHLFSEQVINIFNQQEFPGTEVPLEIIANHTASATINLMQWWLNNGMLISEANMGKHLFTLVFKPIRDMLLEED